MRILVAEDNLLNQELILLMLETLGYSADLAKDGFEVLKALESRVYDVILMDLQMPKMDGITAARQIYEKMGKSRPKIVALSANAACSQDPSLAPWIDDFVSKPVSRETLQRILEGTRPLESEKANLVTPSPHPTLDQNLFLESVGNDPITQGHFATVFQAELTSGIRKLKEAREGGRTVEFLKIAHTLKGASLSVGALRMGQLLAALENGCVSKPASAQTILTAIAQEAECVRLALKTLAEEHFVGP